MDDVCISCILVAGACVACLHVQGELGFCMYRLSMHVWHSGNLLGFRTRACSSRALVLGIPSAGHTTSYVCDVFQRVVGCDRSAV